MIIINVGLASFGMSGLVFHGPLLKANPAYQVCKILERSSNHSVKMFPDSEIVRNYNEIFNDPEIDLIVVNTPDNLHYSMTKSALEAGKHVVVEKPFTLKVSDGEELIKLSEKAGKILTVFQNRRWDSDFLTVKEIVNSGWLGNLIEFELHFDRYKDFIQENTWKEEPGTGSNVLYNLGSHLIDQALVLFGLPDSVFADLNIVRDGSGIIDYFHIHLYYDGFKAILKSSYQVREPGPKYMIHGSRGSYLKFGMDTQEEDLKVGKIPHGSDWGVEPDNYFGRLNTDSQLKKYNRIYPSIPGDYPAFYRNIYESIVSGVDLEVKPIEALNVIRLIHAAEESNRLKKIIQIDYDISSC